MTTETQAEEARREGEWQGLDLANALKPNHDVTEEEAYALNNPEPGRSILGKRLDTLAEKAGWTDVQSSIAHSAAIDAYYDRMTGVR